MTDSASTPPSKSPQSKPEQSPEAGRPAGSPPAAPASAQPASAAAPRVPRAPAGDLYSAIQRSASASPGAPAAAAGPGGVAKPPAPVSATKPTVVESPKPPAAVPAPPPPAAAPKPAAAPVPPAGPDLTKIRLAPRSTRRLSQAEAREVFARLSRALQQFDRATRALTPLAERVGLDLDRADWTRLLRNKLVPQMEGDILMIVAVAGATNTGKSTVFNQLLGEQRSPERVTAAATKQGLIAVRPDLLDRCLGGSGKTLFPEFAVKRLMDPEDVLKRNEQDSIYVTSSDRIPPNLVLFDTPDINSIVKENWEIAEKIMFAADVILAVLHPVAYADKKVVDFCRKAESMGRTVIPVINMIAPDDLHVIINDFRDKSGLDFEYAFWLENDPQMRRGKHRDILAVISGASLAETLSKLDFYQIKSRAVSSSLEVFATSAEKTVRVLTDRIQPYQSAARQVGRELDRAADLAVKKIPFGKMLSLVEQFAQQKRGRLMKGLMYPFNLAFRLTREMGRGTQIGFRWILRRLRAGKLEIPAAAEFDPSEKEGAVEIANELFDRLESIGQTARRDIGDFFRHALTPARRASLAPRMRTAVDALPEYSTSFRDESYRRLEEWWKANPSKTKGLMVADFLVAVLPTAVAVPVALLTGGLHAHDVPWISAAALTPFFNKLLEVMGVPLGDIAMKWRQERVARVREVLAKEVAGDVLEQLRPLAGLDEGDPYRAMTAALKEIEAVQAQIQESPASSGGSHHPAIPLKGEPGKGK